jgi:hypothetical protein
VTKTLTRSTATLRSCNSDIDYDDAEEQQCLGSDADLEADSTMRRPKEIRAQLSWDQEFGDEDGRRRQSTVSFAQAVRDPKYLELVESGLVTENSAEERKEEDEDDDGMVEEPPENYKKDSGYGSQGQLKDVKPVRAFIIF